MLVLDWRYGSGSSLVGSAVRKTGICYAKREIESDSSKF